MTSVIYLNTKKHFLTVFIHGLKKRSDTIVIISEVKFLGWTMEQILVANVTYICA